MESIVEKVTNKFHNKFYFNNNYDYYTGKFIQFITIIVIIIQVNSFLRNELKSIGIHN